MKELESSRSIERSVVLVAALLGAALGAGCNGDDCVHGQVECRDNEIWSCLVGENTPPVWSKVPCGDHRYCRIGTDHAGLRATCALEPNPEPSCDGIGPAPGQRALVACTPDGRVVDCVGGYVTDVVTTCASPELCIATASPPACAVSLTPDPRCPSNASQTTTCMGDHNVTCAAGYLVEDRDCGPGLCYTAGATIPPACVASKTRDPRCPVQPDGMTADLGYGCEGNALFRCLDGLYAQSRDCGADYCEGRGGTATCAYVKP